MHGPVQDMRVCCAADGHTHACAEAQRTPTGTEMHRTDPLLAWPPFPSLHKSSCEMKPTLVTVTPCLAHVFRGVSEPCFVFFFFWRSSS